MSIFDVIIFLVMFTVQWNLGACNLPPVFTQDMNNLALSEATPVGTVVYRLEGFDPEESDVTYGLIGTDNFKVDSKTGDVEVVKPLDRELHDTLSFLVTIKDRLESNRDSIDDNLVKVPINVIVLDENDNSPTFQNVPYECEIREDALPGTTVFDSVWVTDKDSVGENLNVTCLAQSQNLDACQIFSVEPIKSEQDFLKAVVILKEPLDYNDQMIYHLNLLASDGTHTASTGLEIRVNDVQNTPPIFQGSLAAVIDEDSPIGTLVMTIQARDGDRGQPRKIAYDLITNPMDYFLLNDKTGELRTAKPLDKEALEDATGLVVVIVRARELVNGVPLNDDSTISITQASITIRDVNDSPPTFNQNNYFVSLSENTAIGTPLPVEITVTDPDVGQNAIFTLHLEDVSGVFDVEPKLVMGSSQVSIRVANGSLDYENPNQRKFIVLVVAQEIGTSNRTSTATITVSITDTNDNRPVFDEESYSISVLETAHAGQLITTISAKDLDSGHFGEQGIRYSLSGTGAELFHVDAMTGAITVAKCPPTTIRAKRQIFSEENDFDMQNSKNVNVTVVGKTGVIEIDSNTEMTGNELSYHTMDVKDEYDVEKNTYVVDFTTDPSMVDSASTPGTAPCLDYETQPVYFLSYKATDDEGKGQATVVSLRITVIDANDSPPVCESPLYRASLDEGATSFDPPLFIKARDPDTSSDINYKLIGDDLVSKLFAIDRRSGQLTINDTSSLDVNRLKSDKVFFSVEATDGLHTTLCDVNITIRDVNNHAPQFLQKSYMASVVENTEVGLSILQVNATDLDTGVNAEIRYRIQQGSFDDFAINNQTGVVTISRKLDYDKRNTYQMEIVAADQGIPSLSGSASITISIINSNDKDPYFTPATQRAEVREDAEVGTSFYTLVALDPDVATSEALNFAATEPITAVDTDGNEITNSDDFKYLFSIDRTGKVSVNSKLDRSKLAVIRITTLVTDTTASTVQQGKGMLVITIIDVNELPPEFTAPWTPSSPKLHYTVHEEQQIGTVLTKLQAVDADSNIDEYRLEPNDYFEVNAATGLIQSIKRIDYEKIKEINLIATVTDTGVPQLTSTANIVVEVINTNDNDPVFYMNEYVFKVLENSPKGTVIGKIDAKDYDDGVFGEITYSLVGEQSKNFQIEQDSGIIIVINSTILDRETYSEISLTGIASDKGPVTTRKTSAVPISIIVLDVNDNSPIFSQSMYYASVASNAALYPPAAILQLHATDKDDGSFGDIKYFIKSDKDDLFTLDANSGILYPKRSLSGLKGKFVLQVEARDGLGTGPFSDNAEVVIDIQSINNHRPVITNPAQTNSSVEIHGTRIPEKYLVLVVKAYDNDTGDNGKIKYHLQVNNQIVQDTDDFSIDEGTGELRTTRSLDGKKQSKYEIILAVKDQGNPSFETLRFLTINLVDESEHRPEFPASSNPYRFFILENNNKDTRVGKVQAAMKDKHSNQNIYYYMLMGNENLSFYLDKTSGDLYTNKTLDREVIDTYNLYIQCSTKSEFHVSDAERAAFSIKSLDADSSVAKVQVVVLDENDNPPVFERKVYYAGVNAKSSLNQLVVVLNATDKDLGTNGTFGMIIVASNLYKYGNVKSTGSIVPSPFVVSRDGRLSTASYMAEYNQDHFELDIVAKEIEPPEREALAKVFVWIFNPEQLVRVILSRPPSEVHKEQNEIIVELQNATQKRIIIDEIRYHVDSMGRIRMDWCDMFFHAVDPSTQTIVPVDDILKVIDSHYDFLKDYYSGFAIENIVPAHSKFVEEEFDLALAGLVALLIVLFVGTISFLVLCCCLKHWTVSIPTEVRRKDALIKKQIVEDLSTTENPLWIEQKLKLYEEQELTMQVFSEPEINQSSPPLARRDSYETSQHGDNTYATIQPRNASQLGEIADYATLRNNSHPPSMYEFTGSTFQAPTREREGDFVAELI
ncbi:Cadherin-87A [Pseudolycoriella hygida]|uniref:Cadherin-87A n=1 Tax=Pseudolycoriella hygida TaxID=35572 RepID=A0A9Q0MRG1_9DIPT|nr:Cadherin-87A [Pseudolycoriella hygida]